MAVVQKPLQTIYCQISMCNVTRLIFRNRKRIFANQRVTDQVNSN